MTKGNKDGSGLWTSVNWLVFSLLEFHIIYRFVTQENLVWP